MTTENLMVLKDVVGGMCGRRLGAGQFRHVYECTLREDCVLKIEENARDFHNIYEWQVWHSVKGTGWAKYFAPCEWISPSGSVLLMKRTKPAQEKQYPGRMPEFFTDFQWRNWGLLNGKLVCHDYGHHLLLERGMTKRLKKVKWTGEAL